jgi:hypothetical protein
MASRFTALPLPSGESFLLETDVDGTRRVILVDGGASAAEEASKNELFKTIRMHCPDVGDTIDIAICSHQDSDHARGFPAFVKAWLSEGNRIGEFWLPGAWSAVVEDVLTNPDRLVSMLVVGASKAAKAFELSTSAADNLDAPIEEGVPTRVRLVDEEFEQLRRPNGVGELVKDRRLSIARPDAARRLKKHSPEERLQHAATSWGFSAEDWRRIGANMDSGGVHEEPLSRRLRGMPMWVLPFVDIYAAPMGWTLAMSAIDTAEAIRKIATAAVENDIPVRWFDFEAFEDDAAPSGGYRGFLVPLNAVEVKAKGREDDALKLFLKLRLSEQNVASLVFQRVETKTEPAVIFVADSRLAFGVNRPEKDFRNYLTRITRPIVYTAAHHGSFYNDNAYKVLADWLGDLYRPSMAARNGGISRQTLKEYLKIERRRCAQCVQCHGAEWSQLVQVNTENGNWSWPSDHGGICGTPKARKSRSLYAARNGPQRPRRVSISAWS